MENNTAYEVNYRWVIETEGGAYPDPSVSFHSMACNHCAHPACIPSCPVDAISKDADTGVVLIDQDACIGCKRCIAACPYGAPQFNPNTGKVEKCTYCVQRTSQGLLPACAFTCVGGAIQATVDETWDGTPPAGWSKRDYTQPSIKFLGG